MNSPTTAAPALTDVQIEAIARVAYEANRAYCLSLGDDSQPPWDDAADWQTQSVLNGVLFHQEHPGAGPEASHENWFREKFEAGWVYGPVKDPERKEHPCMVPFKDLPVAQQTKDVLFRAVVRALLDGEAEQRPRYDIAWRRQCDPESYLRCQNLTERDVVRRLIGALSSSGPVIVDRVDRIRG